jgi:amino-acid N-acetyltransferase
MSSNRQRHGLGQELVRRLEREAVADGVTVLVLLTQTAEPFFSRLGYVAIDRESAPAEIKASAEFRLLCPASAVCMSKALIPSGERRA